MLGWRGKKEGATEADARGDFNVIFHVILGHRLEEAKTEWSGWVAGEKW